MEYSLTGNPVYDFTIIITVISFLWGALGTAQRRRRLFAAMGGGKSPEDILTPEKLEAIADTLQPHMLRAYTMRRWALGITFFTIALNAFLIWGALNANPFVLILIDKTAGVLPFAAFGLLAIMLMPAAAYKTFLKRTVVPDVAKALGFFYGYRGVGIFNRMLAAEDSVVKASLRQSFLGRSGSLLVGKFDKWEAEDGFESDFLKFEEVQTANIDKTKDGERESVKFRGMIVEITVNRYFPCPVLLLEDLGSLGNAVTSLPGGLERVGLEDPEFESLFEVYSRDQIGARKILTPRFMEKVKQISAYFPAAILSGLFSDNRFYLVVRTNRNLFELGSVLTPPDSYKSLGSLAAQIELQKQLAESLEE